MDCYSMSLFVVCFDVMIMMTLIFPSTETKMAFTHTDGVCHHCTVGSCSSTDGMMENTTLLPWRCQARTSLVQVLVIVTSNVNGGVIDGSWHKVEVAFQNRVRIILGKKFPNFI